VSGLSGDPLTAWEITPHTSAGRVRLGMTKDDVKRVLGPPDKEFVRAPQFCDDVEWIYRGIGAWPSFDRSGTCNAVLMFPECDPVCEGRRLLAVAASTAWAQFLEMDPSAVEDAESLTSHAFGLCLYAPDVHDEPQEQASSLLLFGPGYYDR